MQEADGIDPMTGPSGTVPLTGLPFVVLPAVFRSARLSEVTLDPRFSERSGPARMLVE